jgi:flagellar hook-associated protein 2
MAINSVISQEDIQKLVTQSLASNQANLEAMQSMKSRYEQQQDDWESIRTAATDLNSALEALKSVSTFYSRTASSTDGNILTAIADSDAPIGTYNLTNVILAQAAQKVSAGALGLDGGDYSYYESTASVADLSAIGYATNFTPPSEWAFRNSGHAGNISEEEFFDGIDTISIKTGTASNLSYAQASNNIGENIIPAKFTIEVQTYFDHLGTHVSTNQRYDRSFVMTVDREDFKLHLRFADNGLFAFSDATTRTEVGTDVVREGEWNDWRFEVDASNAETATMNVYKDNVLIATGVDVSYTGDFIDGNVAFRQEAYAYPTEAVDYQAHIGKFVVSQASVDGIVEENLKLDGSEGNANILGEITNGYFEINGTRINVDVSEDTLMEVLSKINASGAGVSAVWDDGNDKIRLLNKSVGGKGIEFGADTSGFFAAMNINTAAPTASGRDAAVNRELDQVAALSPVTDGYFNINGITFSVDTATDSLQDILNRINDSGAGVSAYYSSDLDKVVLTANETGKEVTFGNDTSNFLATIFGDTATATYTAGSVDVNGQTISTAGNELTLNGVTFNLHSASTAGATVSVTRDTESAQAAVETYIEKYNALRDLIDEKTSSTLRNDRILRQISNNLRLSSIQSITNAGNYHFLRDVGIEYSSGRLSLNASALSDAFNNDPDSVYKLFGYDTNNDGIRDDGGLSNVMYNSFLKDITRKSSGTVYQRTQLIKMRIDRVASDITKYQKVIDRKETRLWNEYTRFAEAVNSMSQQYTQFSAQLSILNSLTSSLYSSSSQSSSF